MTGNKISLVGAMGVMVDLLAKDIVLYAKKIQQDCHLAEFRPDSECRLDHGERTNYKLQDQPFYMRGRNGKMRGY